LQAYAKSLEFFSALALNSLKAMNSITHFKKIAALAGLTAAVALSSCTLPPAQAWRKIRTDGLIAYWSYELQCQREYMPSNGYRRATYSTPLPSSMLAQNRPHISPYNRPGMLERGPTLTAQSIPALPGFVRSPYTNPPRLVDVKGATPGSTMICPYTQRPFVVPPDFNTTPNTAVANVTPTSPAPTPALAPAPSSSVITNPPAPQRKMENMPKVVIGNQTVEPPPSRVAPAPVQPKSTPPAKPAPAVSAPSTAIASSPAPVTPSQPAAAAPKPVQEVPYGSPIAGRPGFVNSPFAAKHQLVDVTGLPAGMEVKCPYTGKLFRVPPQDMVSSKPAETAPLASPEEPKKK
jgi:hypothetical protein